MDEPVAWIDKSKLDDWLHGDCYPDQCFIHYQANDAIPLYTHPVKELTDEEIEECFAESCTDFKLLENGKTKGVVNIIDVGRAILRKAQEADKIESLGTVNIGGVHYKNGKEVK